MGTKKIREALDLLIDRGEPEASKNAMDEVLEIERAAELWGEADVGTVPKKVHDLLWSIRKESLR
jgi:hypothetical protein